MVKKGGLFSSLTRLGNGHNAKEKSPFSSPYTGFLSSPVAVRRTSLEERRRPAADFDQDVSPGCGGKAIDEPEEERNIGGEQDEHIDEDGEEEMSPLLPIFSAAHLGLSFLQIIIFSRLTRVQMHYPFTT